ncbi:MAG: spore coat protein U domain-containing protein [Spirochaetota bacterium]
MKASFCCAMILVLVGPALSAQAIAFQSLPTAITGSYDGNSGTTLPQVFSLGYSTPTTEGNASGAFFVTVSPGLYGNFSQRALSGGGGQRMAYQVYDSATSRKVLKDLSVGPGREAVLSGVFPVQSNRKTETLSFVVVVPAGQMPYSGIYQDVLVLNLYQGTPDNHGPSVGTASVTVTLAMPAVMDMSLARTGGAFLEGIPSLNLDFGALSIGEIRSADLIVRSNTPYSLSVSSQFGSTLMNVDSASTGMVPLQFKVKGVVFSLAQGALTPLVSVATPPPADSAGERFDLLFTVGDFDLAPAGNYRNVLSFTLTAK